jgi:hypothetical protein
MAPLHSWALPWEPLIGRRAGARIAALVLGVGVWWLLILGAIVLTITMTEQAGKAEGFSIAPGQDAHLTGGQLSAWLIPIERVTFDDYHGRVLVGREGAITDDRVLRGWIGVVEGQAVRITVVGGNAVQVELLEPPNIGGHGWLPTEYLRP